MGWILRRSVPLTVFTLLFWVDGLDADIGVKSRSLKAQLTIESPDVRTSDLALFGAERMAMRFQELTGQKLSESRVTLFLQIAENETETASSMEVKFQTEGVQPQVCVEFSKVPLSMDLLQRGCGRGLWSRGVWEICYEDWEHGRVPSKARDLRIPLWILEGMTVLLLDSHQKEEIMGYSIILAKLQESWSLDELALELEGRTEWNSMGRSLAALICEAALGKEAENIRKFMGLMNWRAGWKIRDWLRALRPTGNLDEWWQEVWQAHGRRLPIQRMSFRDSAALMMQLSSLGESCREDEEKRQEFERFSLKSSSAIHPWFIPWLSRDLQDKGSELWSKNEMNKRIAEIRERRLRSLDWLAQCEIRHVPVDPKSFLEWDLYHRDALKLTSASSGPAREWLDRISH